MSKNKTHTITSREVDNLANRLQATRASKDYNARQFVDVPVELAEGLIALARDAIGGTTAVRIKGSPQ